MREHDGLALTEVALQPHPEEAPWYLISAQKTQTTIAFVYSGVPAYVKLDIKCL